MLNRFSGQTLDTNDHDIGLPNGIRDSSLPAAPQVL